MPLADIQHLGGAASFTVSHILETMSPQAEVFERTADGWRLMADTEYDFRTTANDTAVLTFASARPAVPLVGSIRLQLTATETLAAASPIEYPVLWPATSQLEGLNMLAQNGQELSRETLWPCSITLPGVTGPIAASGGSLRETGVQLMMGGLMGEYALAFRVRKDLLPSPPEVNTFVGYQGRPWLIMRVINDPRDSVYAIGADNSSK